MRLAGIIFIVLGILALVYQGIRYTTQERVLKAGPITVTATEKKTIPLPPIAGGAAVVVGIALVFMDRRKK